LVGGRWGGWGVVEWFFTKFKNERVSQPFVDGFPKATASKTAATASFSRRTPGHSARRRIDVGHRSQPRRARAVAGLCGKVGGPWSTASSTVVFEKSVAVGRKGPLSGAHVDVAVHVAVHVAVDDVRGGPVDLGGSGRGAVQCLARVTVGTHAAVGYVHKGGVGWVGGVVG
jgi:hypothetical protein